MLTMEIAAKSVFPVSGGLFFESDAEHERQRKWALACAAQALTEMEELGLRCGVFGSALRPGDFFHNSDVDMAAWLPCFIPLDAETALRARVACHRCMGDFAFDLVCLPAANEAFADRIVRHWCRRSSEVAKAAQGLELSVPLSFGPKDVAFIDRDRLAIAARAASRMAHAHSEYSKEQHADSADILPDRIVLSLCASMQTVVRVAEKCAKDVLREFARIKPPRDTQRPLYPLLCYPCEALNGARMASEASLELYFECSELLEPPASPNSSWAKRMAALAMLFSESMSMDFEPALQAMSLLPAPEPF